MRATVLVANTRRGLARAIRLEDGTWRVEHLLTSLNIRCLTPDTISREVLFAGTQGDGVLRSDDRGQTWQPAGLPNDIVKALAARPAEPATIYAGTKPPLLYVSDDRGLTWQELKAFREIPGRDSWYSPAEPPGTAYIHAITLSPEDPDVIIAGIEAGAVVRSTDGGRSWSGHLPEAVRDCHTLAFHPTDGSWVYEGGGTGAAVSTDAGATWTQPRDGLDRHYCWAVAADPQQPDSWYVSASPGPRQAHSDGNAQAYIYRKRGSAPWERLAGGLPQPLDYMPYTLIADADAPGHLYAGLRNGDVWHSLDHGDHWQQLPVNLGAIDHTLIMYGD